MITKAQLKELIESPEAFVPVTPTDSFQQAPRFLLKDISRCFAGLDAFIKDEAVNGKQLTFKDVELTYDFLEKGLFSYLLKRRTLYQIVNRQATQESLMLLSRYKGLKAQCEAKRRLAA